MRLPVTHEDTAAFGLFDDDQLLGIAVSEPEVVGQDVDAAEGVGAHDRLVAPEFQRGRPLTEKPPQHIDALDQGANGNHDHHEGEHRHHFVVFQHARGLPILARETAKPISTMKTRCCIYV